MGHINNKVLSKNASKIGIFCELQVVFAKNHFDCLYHKFDEEVVGFPTYEQLIRIKNDLEEDIEKIDALFSTFIPKFREYRERDTEMY